jgi:hypothetical protein
MHTHRHADIFHPDVLQDLEKFQRHIFLVHSVNALCATVGQQLFNYCSLFPSRYRDRCMQSCTHLPISCIRSEITLSYKHAFVSADIPTRTCTVFRLDANVQTPSCLVQSSRCQRWRPFPISLPQLFTHRFIINNYPWTNIFRTSHSSNATIAVIAIKHPRVLLHAPLLGDRCPVQLFSCRARLLPCARFNEHIK